MAIALRQRMRVTKNRVYELLTTIYCPLHDVTL